MRAAALVVVTAVLAAAAAAGAAAPPRMADQTSYDVLTYSAWGRQNNVSGAECTGVGPAGHVLLGATHESFRCQVQVGGTPVGTVAARVEGPESLRVTSVAGTRLKRDAGLGVVPHGTPTFKNFDAVTALQKSSWAKAHHVSRALCFGVGPYRPTSTTAYFFAFSCATFDSSGVRGAQVLVTVADKTAVRVVRTLAK